MSIDLAGENPTLSLRAHAVINNPLEPRLFVYRRDGSALELLRADDARKWCEGLSVELPPPLQKQQQRHQSAVDGKDVGRRRVPGTAVTAAVVEEECCADPHSQGTRQVSSTPSARAVSWLTTHFAAPPSLLAGVKKRFWDSLHCLIHPHGLYFAPIVQGGGSRPCLCRFVD